MLEVTWTITHMQLWQHAWRVEATVSMIFFTQWMQSMEKYATFYSAEMTKAWTNKRNPSSDITLIIEHYDNWFDKQTSSNYLKVSKLIRRLIHCYFFRWIFSASGITLKKKKRKEREKELFELFEYHRNAEGSKGRRFSKHVTIKISIRFSNGA